MSRRIKNSEDVLKAIRKKHDLRDIDQYQERIQNKLVEDGEVSARTAKSFDAYAERAEREKYVAKINRFDELGLLTFYEDSNPDRYDDAVKILSNCIKSTKSSIKYLIEESEISWDEIALAIYKNVIKIGKPIYDEDGNFVRKDELEEGEPIPLKSLVISIEAITNSAAKHGIAELKRKRPFFFQ